MLVISNSLVLSEATEAPPWSPVVGWHNLVTADNVEADTEENSYPATNLATVLTVERWQASTTAEQRIIVTPEFLGEIDYIAVARHNFGSAQISVSVEVYTELDEGSPVWVEVVQQVLLADDSPVLFRFDPQAVVGVCLRLRTGDAVARAAVLYVGKLLILKPTIQTDFTPLNYGRVTDVVNDTTENGEFLGRTVLSETLESSVRLMYLDPQWYRAEMAPFVASTSRRPFFFAWDPLNYPREIGFAWIKAGSNPRPSIYENVGLMSIELSMGGLAL